MRAQEGEGPRLVLRRRGVIVGRLWPGERRLVGRAPAADIQLGHPEVSRLHARLSWPEGRARPIVEDLASANGVWLDGRRIARLAELRDQMTLGLGSIELSIELAADLPPAVLDDHGTVKVSLFSEAGPEQRGVAADQAQLRALLLALAARRRTGTLELAGRGELTFAGGRIVDARAGDLEGPAAVGRLLSASRPGAFRFRLEVSACESRLDLSVRDALAAAAPPTVRYGAGTSPGDAHAPTVANDFAGGRGLGRSCG